MPPPIRANTVWLARVTELKCKNNKGIPRDKIPSGIFLGLQLCHHRPTVMKILPRSLSLSCVCATLACAGPSAQSTTTSPEPPVEGAVTQEEAPPGDTLSLPTEKDDAAAELGSVVSGPALDDLPPPPPAAVSHQPIDFSELKEPPRLTLNAQGHNARISELLYTHDGRSLVTASYDKTVRVWSATTGELERTIFGERGEGTAGRIHAASLSKGDRWLAVGGWLGTDGTPARSSSSSAFQIRVFDFRSETGYRLLSGHRDAVLSLAFAHESTKLLSGGGDGQAFIWDVDRAQSERRLRGHHKGVTSVAWSPDDKRVATASADGSAFVFDAATGEQVAQLEGHNDTIGSITFTPSGRSVLTGCHDGTVRIFDAKSGKQLKVLADLKVPIGSIAIAPSGLEVLVTLAAPPFAAIVYNIKSGRKLAAYTGHDNVVLASAISPNGKWVATAGGTDFAVSVFGIKDGKRQIYTKGHGQTVWNVGFAKDGSSVAWGHDFEAGRTGQYQINGVLRHKLDLAKNSRPLSVQSIPSEQNDFVRALERAQGIEVRTRSGKEDPILEVWKDGHKRTSIRRDLRSGFVHRAFSLTNDGSVVVSGGDNGTLSSYDTQTGRLLSEFEGHTGDILAVALSPDNRWVVSGSSDQTARIWDLKSGSLLLTIFRAKNGEWAAYTPFGYYAASPFGDGYVGFVANRGPGASAAYFPSSALSAQLRFDGVVRHHLYLGPDIKGSIDACNALLGSAQTQVNYYRFEDLPQFAPPYVYYLDPGNDLRIESDRLRVTARAHSPTNAPIDELTFLINGRPMDERWMNHVGRPRLRLMGNEAEITATLPLPNSSNRISVVASNRYNQSEPLSFEVQRTGGPKELEKLYQPELYMLSIGISDYGSVDAPSLAYAHLDAEELAETFKKQNKSLFKRVETRVLTERSASASRISSHLKWWASRASQKDLAVVFLSGHAAQAEDGQYYFVPHDADVARLSETAFKLADLKAALESLPAKVLLIVDTSHAGAAAHTAASATEVDIASLIRGSFSPRSGIAVMAASSGTEQSFESDQWKHGAFTVALLEALKGRADYDRDRVVFLKEVAHYLQKRVPALTGGRQHPTVEIPSTLPNFPLSQR